MSRLEEKLKELGYENDFDLFYIKTINTKYDDMEIIIKLTKKKNKIKYSELNVIDANIRKIKHIKTIEKSFNQMQKDLEVLRNVED